MRIGFDARKLRGGGIGTYVRNLLVALVGHPGPRDLAVFLNAEDQGRIDWPRPGAAEFVVKAGHYSLAEHIVLARAARAARVDLFHAPHYTLPLGWGGASIVTIHDLTHVRFARFFPPGTAVYARAMAGAAARRARLVIVDSRSIRDDVVELLRIPGERVRVIPLGVAPGLNRRPPEAVAAFAGSRSLPSDYLLYVGARKPHKNLGLVLRALGTIEERRRPPLVLSGPRWRADHRLAQLTTRLGLERIVHFAGELADDEDLALLYSGASLYVHPSLAEGFGLPPLEAMACGVPVLSADSGALPETLGDAAMLLEPARPEAWAAAISEILEDRERGEALRRRGHERARTFTWARAAAFTLAAYEESMCRGS